LWWFEDAPQLGARARAEISQSLVRVSVAVGWEIEIKKKIGKLNFPDDFEERIAGQGFQGLPISITHALAAGRLPLHHRDPFDRLLIAQAQCEQLTLVTADERFKAYDIDVLMA
jgi:PIN domain nuclease of toxin-antitoxin system